MKNSFFSLAIYIPTTLGPQIRAAGWTLFQAGNGRHPCGHCQDSVGVELAGFAAKLKQLTSGPLVCVGPFKALEEALVMCSHAHGILWDLQKGGPWLPPLWPLLCTNNCLGGAEMARGIFIKPSMEKADLGSL